MRLETCVRPSVCLSILTLKHVCHGDQPADRNQIYQKYDCVEALPALGLNAGRIRTLVSMATDSSHKVTTGKILSTF